MNARQLAFVASRLFAVFYFFRTVEILPIALQQYWAIGKLGSPNGVFSDLIAGAWLLIVEVPLLLIIALFFWYRAGLVASMVSRGVPSSSSDGNIAVSFGRAASIIAGWIILAYAIIDLSPVLEAFFVSHTGNNLSLVSPIALTTIGISLVIGPKAMWRGLENFYNVAPDEEPTIRD